MCRLLKISRSIIYYQRKNKRKDIELENHIIKIFKESKNNASFEELEIELFDYVNWYNNFRIHSSLDYLTPVEYRVVNGENV